MELREILTRIEKRLEVVGLSASAASREAGKPDAIRNLQRAVEKDDRQGVSTATLNALAPVLKTTAVWLFAGAGPEELGSGAQSSDAPSSSASGATLITEKTAMVPIVGDVEAGAFREAPEFEPDDIEYVTDYPDKEFPHARRIGFRVRGDSMNGLKPRPMLEGDKVIGLDFHDLEGLMVLRDGLVVVVEQTRDGGHTREWSVKQLEIHEDRYEFCPRSTSLRHKPIVVPKTVFHDPSEDDGRQVRILALVRRVISDVTY
ncbi:LexA family protein [Microvirga lenta]|uniref:LexA family protein n=1 Tax=Microvirga lenta TaxID=2881337 RepID=UPI001CFC4C81|nr:S24 family peptidase [Microvirga lenta]MCB5173683.1 S24 family peptidase [Microvirga lenta]